MADPWQPWVDRLTALVDRSPDPARPAADTERLLPQRCGWAHAG